MPTNTEIVQAIKDSLAHWWRMVKWSEENPHFDENELLMYMLAELKEIPNSNYCALCKIFNKCNSCLLKTVDKKCNGPNSAYQKSIYSFSALGFAANAKAYMIPALEKCLKFAQEKEGK